MLQRRVGLACAKVGVGCGLWLSGKCSDWGVAEGALSLGGEAEAEVIAGPVLDILSGGRGEGGMDRLGGEVADGGGEAEHRFGEAVPGAAHHLFALAEE